MWFMAMAAIAANGLLGGMVAIFFGRTFSGPGLLSVAAFIGFLFLLVNVVFFLVYRETQRDLLDTLSLDIIIDKGDSDQRTERYLSIVKIVEDHLVRNRLNFETRLEGRRFGGPFRPYGKVFLIRAYGLTLGVKRDKIGRFTGVASIFVGPASGPSDPVPRRLLEGLRQEFLRCEKSGAPEKNP
ncbi:MAG: hypothetical protein FJ149_08135 [Euryarchaeota archaeon]|nr:hypothetical protein [Euryarchaeota archaeon]